MGTQVIVFSDYICPFCYVGYRRLERLAQEMTIAVEWKGVEIHPETPPGGKAMSPSLSAKLSNPEGAIQWFAQEEGIELQVPAMVANSRLALEASEYAREQGKFPQFHRAIFESYWREGKNISDIDTVAEIAQKVGLDREGLIGFLQEGKGADKLRQNQREAEEWGVVGVPSFVFANRFLIEGVQAYPVLKRAAEKADPRLGGPSD